MKKMIKLSLVAAVAVAGLTTSATAGSLENAIKDTTISGKAMVGYNYADTKIAGGVATPDDTTNQTEYDIDLTLNTKVNDTISTTVGFESDNVTENRDGATVTNTINMTKLYFTAKTDVATVMVGKQGNPTPFLDDNRGDGVVALIPAGPVTVAAGHFTGMNGGQSIAKGDTINLNLSQRDISALAVIATAGPVNVQAWYVTASDAGEKSATSEDLTAGTMTNDLEHGLDAYSVNLSGKFGPVNVELNHASAQLDSAAGYNFDDETLTKLVVSGAVSGVNLVAGYGFTNDANHNNAPTASTRYHGVDLTYDDDAKTNFSLDQIVLDDHNDANALLLGASMTFGQTTVGASYLMATINSQVAGTSDTDATELDLTVAYAMSKNFSITGLYSTAETETTTKQSDEDRIELSLNYKF